MAFSEGTALAENVLVRANRTGSVSTSLITDRLPKSGAKEVAELPLERFGA